MNFQRILTLDESAFCLSTNGSPEPTCPAGARWRDAPFDAETRRFFGAHRHDLLTRSASYPLYDLPQLYEAFGACFPDWRLVAEGGGPDARAGALWTPETAAMLVAPGRRADFALEATRFYVLPAGGRRVLAVEEWHDGRDTDSFRVRLVGPSGEAKALADEFAALIERMKRPHYLQSQVLKAEGEILESFQRRGWDEVALDPAIRTVWQGALGFRWSTVRAFTCPWTEIQRLGRCARLSRSWHARRGKDWKTSPGLTKMRPRGND